MLLCLEFCLKYGFHINPGKLQILVQNEIILNFIIILVNQINCSQLWAYSYMYIKMLVYTNHRQRIGIFLRIKIQSFKIKLFYLWLKSIPLTLDFSNSVQIRRGKRVGQGISNKENAREGSNLRLHDERWPARVFHNSKQ